MMILLYPQLLDKINTDTEMDDIIQDYNAVSLLDFVKIIIWIVNFIML